ncbi:hypothetical protein [Actinoalloteichus hymeniacidonis]|uniref:Fe-S cluster assembly iron-binding protein IscA n=1 Tax=Actinoalloteichus hymeniacidonis TaxID=340345 RepID=A0AAC9HKU9_9PSEU|nr:hypothetical protein [Actinoalloteichus hymeniacidonis]AOS61001.1 hypothetical protein TL08_00770 [Actinoalloteichus hymeniacidonis]MBB5910999.1 Fe-S cluster assembly iron-binding protein IscA [Actinoalloteichus hymeniacidonis]
MLTVTDTAAETIRTLLADHGAPEDGGLRITASRETETETALELALVATGEEGDQAVSAQAGTKVYLDRQAADILEDKLLDAHKDVDGQLNFALREQSE